jgi:hypothetical protein
VAFTLVNQRWSRCRWTLADMTSYLVRCRDCGREWPIVVDDSDEAHQRVHHFWPHLRCICGAAGLLLLDRRPHAAVTDGDDDTAGGRTAARRAGVRVV